MGAASRRRMPGGQAAKLQVADVSDEMQSPLRLRRGLCCRAGHGLRPPVAAGTSLAVKRLAQALALRLGELQGKFVPELRVCAVIVGRAYNWLELPAHGSSNLAPHVTVSMNAKLKLLSKHRKTRPGDRHCCSYGPKSSRCTEPTLQRTIWLTAPL